MNETLIKKIIEWTNGDKSKVNRYIIYIDTIKKCVSDDKYTQKDITRLLNDISPYIDTVGKQKARRHKTVYNEDIKQDLYIATLKCLVKYNEKKSIFKTYLTKTISNNFWDICNKNHRKDNKGLDMSIDSEWLDDVAVNTIEHDKIDILDEMIIKEEIEIYYKNKEKNING